MKPTQTKQKEYKIYLADFKATNDKEGIVEGYINAIGNVDDGDDRSMPNAFKRTVNAAYARKSADPSLDFLWPYLWNHDYTLVPPGGIFEASEEKKGLFTKVQLNLDYQLGRDLYSSFKMGTVNKQSMGYICHKSEMVKEDDKWVRNLLEIEVMEGSAVVFPMNQDATITGVKSGIWTPQRYWSGFTLEEKSVCGNTSGPIGPRDESWSGSKAEKQIWAAAEKDDGSITASVAKKYFMVCDGDGSKKGDYGYPFWYVGDSPHICVGAVKAIAGAIGGARGAHAPAGLAGKVRTLYARINKKYPDAEPLTLDGKAQRRHMDTKDFGDNLRARQISSWRDDLWDLFYALRQSLEDIFANGDDPLGDLEAIILNDGDDSQGFTSALQDHVQRGIDLDYSNYLTEQSGPSGSNYYGIMAADDAARELKAGGMSAAKRQQIQDHIDALHDHADSHLANAKKQSKALHSAADDLASVLQGSEPAYTTDPGTPEKRDSRQALAHKDHSSSVDTDLETAMAELAELRTSNN